MYPAPFDYHRATSVDEAVALLQEHGDGAKLLAGGHSLLPAMKLRLAQPAALIDLGRVDGLRGVEHNADGLTLGAMTTYAEIARLKLSGDLEALTEAAANIGDAQVRNRGTIGGNLAHADPASDLPAVALALNATLLAVGPTGKREIAADDFFLGLFETALGSDELLLSVTFPAFVSRSARATGSAYEKFENPASGYALCGVAAWLAIHVDGTVQACRVAVTGAADHAQRLSSVEAVLTGQAPTADAIAKACADAGDGLSFLSDIHADEKYRANLVRVLARRALTKAAARAGA